MIFAIFYSAECWTPTCSHFTDCNSNRLDKTSHLPSPFFKIFFFICNILSIYARKNVVLRLNFWSGDYGFILFEIPESENHTFNGCSHCVCLYQHNSKPSYGRNSKFGNRHLYHTCMPLEIFCEGQENSLYTEVNKRILIFYSLRMKLITWYTLKCSNWIKYNKINTISPMFKNT